MTRFSILNWAIAKPLSFFAGRAFGEAEANKVSADVQARIEGELNANKPLLLTVVDSAAAGLDEVATITVDYARTKIVGALSNTKTTLSSDAQARVITAVETVAAPAAETAAEKLVATFVSDVKTAISKL